MNNKIRSNFPIIMGIILIIAIGIGIVILARFNKIVTEETVHPVEPSTPIVSVELPSEYPSQEAIDDGYYVDLHGNIYNEDVMIEFVEKVSQKQSATIRTVLYTVEGDPIITDFSYNTNSFSVTKDATRDRYGLQSTTTRKLNNLISYYDAELKTTYFYITDLSEISEEQFKEEIDGVLLKIEQSAAG